MGLQTGLHIVGSSLVGVGPSGATYDTIKTVQIYLNPLRSLEERSIKKRTNNNKPLFQNTVFNLSSQLFVFYIQKIGF